MAKRLFIVGSKGSSAKSTLVLGFAKLAADIWPHLKIGIIDLDSHQWTATQFSKHLNLPLVPESEADFVLMDGGAKLSDLEYHYKSADKILLCCTPSPLDIPVNQTFARNELTPYADKTRILFTRVRTISKLDKDIATGEEPYTELFSDFIKMKSFMRETVDYRHFVMTGKLSEKITNELSRILLEINL